MSGEQGRPLPPRHNPRLFGHGDALARMRRAVDRGRMPHAWLLRGPRGVGKATFAWHIARELLAGPGQRRICHRPDSPLFRQVAQGGHPELYLLEKGIARGPERRSEEIAVDDVRALLERLQTTATLPGYRVVMVEEADRLNRNAANALLKMLEEPPPRMVFLLVTQTPAALPPTIVSRCAQLVLHPLEERLVVEALEELLGLPAEEARRFAALAGGCIGRAIELAGSGFLEAYGTVLNTLAGAASAGDVLSALTVLRAYGGDRGGLRGFALLGEIVRRAVRLEAGMPPAIELVARERAGLAALASRHRLDRLAALWDKLQAFARRGEWLHLESSQALIVMLDELAGVPDRGGGGR